MNDLSWLMVAIAIIAVTGFTSVGYTNGEQAKAMATMVSKGADPLAAACAMGVNNMNRDMCLAIANKK